MFDYITWSPKDKHKEVWEQTQLIPGHEPLKWKKSYESLLEAAYQLCAFSKTRTLGRPLSYRTTERWLI